MAGSRSTAESAARGEGRRFGIVASRYHEGVVDRLLAAAVDSLREHGVSADAIETVRVPGAWEIPLALHWLAASGRFDGLVALGLVLRGETPHFDYVSAECSRGVAAVAERHGLPVAFGVLTCDTLEQATARSGGDGTGGGAGNKGREAALAALDMADLRQRLAAAG
jgi:6,7-dimethyl-8-ribityllumazine synthase